MKNKNILIALLSIFFFFSCQSLDFDNYYMSLYYNNTNKNNFSDISNDFIIIKFLLNNNLSKINYSDTLYLCILDNKFNLTNLLLNKNTSNYILQLELSNSYWFYISDIINSKTNFYILSFKDNRNYLILNNKTKVYSFIIYFISNNYIFYGLENNYPDKNYNFFDLDNDNILDFAGVLDFNNNNIPDILEYFNNKEYITNLFYTYNLTNIYYPDFYSLMYQIVFNKNIYPYVKNSEIWSNALLFLILSNNLNILDDNINNILNLENPTNLFVNLILDNENKKFINSILLKNLTNKILYILTNLDFTNYIENKNINNYYNHLQGFSNIITKENQPNNIENTLNNLFITNIIYITNFCDYITNEDFLIVNSSNFLITEIEIPADIFIISNFYSNNILLDTITNEFYDSFFIYYTNLYSVNIYTNSKVITNDIWHLIETTNILLSNITNYFITNNIYNYEIIEISIYYLDDYVIGASTNTNLISINYSSTNYKVYNFCTTYLEITNSIAEYDFEIIYTNVYLYYYLVSNYTKILEIYNILQIYDDDLLISVYTNNNFITNFITNYILIGCLNTNINYQTNILLTNLQVQFITNDIIIYEISNKQIIFNVFEIINFYADETIISNNTNIINLTNFITETNIYYVEFINVNIFETNFLNEELIKVYSITHQMTNYEIKEYNNNFEIIRISNLIYNDKIYYSFTNFYTNSNIYIETNFISINFLTNRYYYTNLNEYFKDNTNINDNNTNFIISNFLLEYEIIENEILSHFDYKIINSKVITNKKLLSFTNYNYQIEVVNNIINNEYFIDTNEINITNQEFITNRETNNTILVEITNEVNKINESILFIISNSIFINNKLFQESNNFEFLLNIIEMGRLSNINNIYIQEGTFSYDGDISADKSLKLYRLSNINISGGWNEDFSKVIGYTFLNGNNNLPHIVEITESYNINFENFIIYNGNGSELYNIPIGDSGGGILLKNSSNIIISNIILSNNYAINGGGLTILNSISNNIYVDFINNYAENIGGGIYLSNSYFNFIYGNFYSNKSSYGGCIGLEYSSNNNLFLNSFDNLSFDNGAVVFINDSMDVYINNSIITNNISEGKGVIFITNSKNVFIDNLHSRNNISLESGSIIHCYDGNFIYISNSIFNQNFSNNIIYFWNSRSINLISNEIINNSEGLYFENSKIINIFNSIISNNGNRKTNFCLFFNNCDIIDIKNNYFCGNDNKDIAIKYINSTFNINDALLNDYDIYKLSYIYESSDNKLNIKEFISNNDSCLNRKNKNNNDNEPPLLILDDSRKLIELENNNSVYNLSGKAIDNYGIENVYISINNNKYIHIGKERIKFEKFYYIWNYEVQLNNNTNYISIYATDCNGNVSKNTNNLLIIIK